MSAETRLARTFVVILALAGCQTQKLDVILSTKSPSNCARSGDSRL